MLTGLAAVACGAYADTIEYIDANNRVWYYTPNNDGQNTVTIGRGGTDDNTNYAVSRDVEVDAADIPWTFMKNNVSYIVTQISQFAFGKNSGDNNSLKGTMTIPASVTSIGQRAFQNCKGLTCLASIGGVTTMSNYAFNGCSNMEGDISDLTQVTTFGTGVFQSTKLTGDVTLNSSLSTIAERLFNGCGITGITVSRKVTAINARAFEYTALSGLFVPGPATIVFGTQQYTTFNTQRAVGGTTTPKIILCGPNTKGTNLADSTMVYAATDCKVYVPANGFWDGLKTGGTRTEIIYYGAGRDFDLEFDNELTTMIATPTTEHSLSNVLELAAAAKRQFGLNTKINITNAIEATEGLVTSEMLANATFDALMFTVRTQEQLNNVLAAVPADIQLGLVIDPSDDKKEPLSLPADREVWVRLSGNGKYVPKVNGLIISLH